MILCASLNSGDLGDLYAQMAKFRSDSKSTIDYKSNNEYSFVLSSRCELKSDSRVQGVNSSSSNHPYSRVHGVNANNINNNINNNIQDFFISEEEKRSKAQEAIKEIRLRC